jgi:hypothetical protein
MTEVENQGQMQASKIAVQGAAVSRNLEKTTGQ